jgi:nucleoside-diphosphate-sugar epimerase
VTSDAPGSGAALAAAESRGPLRERFADEVVLITGFPGFRAQALVRTLALRESNASFWFVVPPSEIEVAARVLAASPLSDDRLRLIPGEPCAIDLGLSRQVYGELAQRVDRWFALYQTTDTLAPRELCFRVNLGSAREIAELSKAAESLSHVTFLSSSLVFGDHQGDAAEEDLMLGQSFRSAASESLALAEAFLRRRLADAPVSVVRTPQVLGARDAGAPARPSGLHRLLAHVAGAPNETALPLPPGSHRPVQVLPADFVADALYAAAALGTRGRTYHFAEPDPPSLAEVLDHAARHFGRRFEQGFDPRTLGRLLLRSPGFWLSQQSSRALSEWAEGPPLLTRGGDRLLERAGLRVPALIEYLDVVLRETDELVARKQLTESRASQPFEVVA